MKYHLLSFLIAITTSLTAQSGKLDIIKVTDSIYVFKPYIDYVHGNGVAIIGNNGIFFIDTFLQANYASEAIRQLKKLTKLPVMYVLNTHGHNDHVMGNYEFLKAFSGCKIIAHNNTYTRMIKRIKPAVDNELATMKSDVTQLAKELSEGKLSSGVPLTEPLKRFWKQLSIECKEYIDHYSPNKFSNADITFSDSLIFHWGSQTLQLIYASDNGHSPGDVIVWIPEKKLVVTGDIIVAPTPYAGYPNVYGLVKSIQKIIDMNPRIIIPGHGPVQYDLTYPQLLRKAFTGYINEAEKAFDNGIDITEAIKSISIPEVDNAFTGSDDVKKWAYQSFFIDRIIKNTYNLKSAQKNK